MTSRISEKMLRTRTEKISQLTKLSLRLEHIYLGGWRLLVLEGGNTERELVFTENSHAIFEVLIAMHELLIVRGYNTKH
jgi:hypothetical protein